MIQAEERRVPPERAHDELAALKARGYNMLVDLTAVDCSAIDDGPKGDASDRLKRAHPAERLDLVHEIASAEGEEYGTPKPKVAERRLSPRKERFEVVYRLMRLDPRTGLDEGRVHLYCEVPEAPPLLRSVMDLWPAADWLEREVWDMFGIRFVDRPDIKRLLLYEEFKGHPLRKDYPITKRQPLVGPSSGEPANNPSFNSIKPALRYD